MHVDLCLSGTLGNNLCKQEKMRGLLVQANGHGRIFRVGLHEEYIFIFHAVLHDVSVCVKRWLPMLD